MKKNSIALLILSLILIGCSDTRKNVRIDNVKKVFLQNEREYILYTQKPGSNQVESFKLSARYDQKVKIVTDVEKGASSWVEGVRVDSGTVANQHYFENVTLHIHSLNEIQGGEFQTSGKNPKTIKNSLVE